MKALVTKNIEKHKQALDKERKTSERMAALSKTRYKDLTDKDKDDLLKLIAVRLGILKE